MSLTSGQINTHYESNLQKPTIELEILLETESRGSLAGNRTQVPVIQSLRTMQTKHSLIRTAQNCA